MRSLSDQLSNLFKCKLSESSIDEASIQKVLRLFGYPNASNQRYVCCIGYEPRIDIHTFSIGTSFFVMCLITNDKKLVIDAGLWTLKSSFINKITYSDFESCNSIDDIDVSINKLTDNHYTFVMRYNP